LCFIAISKAIKSSLSCNSQNDKKKKRLTRERGRSEKFAKKLNNKRVEKSKEQRPK
jgi:hypothetical protein